MIGSEVCDYSCFLTQVTICDQLFCVLLGHSAGANTNRCEMSCWCTVGAQCIALHVFREVYKAPKCLRDVAAKVKSCTGWGCDI